MFKKVFRTLGIAALVGAAFSFSAFADENITTIKFTCGPDPEASIAEGINMPYFECDSDEYTLDSFSDYNEDSSAYKTARTYELTFRANDGYIFPDESYVTVSATGIDSITKKKQEDDEYTFTIRCKAYCYYQWAAPEITDDSGIGGYDKNAASIKWDKKGAPSVEYVLVYYDTYGDDHTVHSTSSSTSLKITTYNKAKPTATSSNDYSDRIDGYVSGFAIRGTGNAGSNSRVVPSVWVHAGDDVDTSDYTSYETWAEAFGGSTSSSSSSSSASKSSTQNANSSSSSSSSVANANSGIGPGSVTAGWVGSGDNWYWKNSSGTYSTGWVQWNGDWYFCDSTGKMTAGWRQDTSDGNWYYMNENHDGTYGKMVTGWRDINGKRYYFRPNSGGPQGSMVTGAQTIDGASYTFGDDGALQ